MAEQVGDATTTTRRASPRHAVTRTPKGWSWPLIAVGVATWIVRGERRLAQPTFWAEDGLVFFTQEAESGWRSFTTSYAGYLHAVPRISAAALSALPVSSQMRGYAVVASLLSLATLAGVLNPRLAWLLPTPLARAGTFLLLAAMPGLWESYGNVANLIFFGGIGLALVALADDPRSLAGRGGEWLVVVLLGLSGPDVAMIVPLFVYRLVRARSRHSLLLLVSALATAVTQYEIFLRSSRATADTGTVATLLRELLERVVGALLVGDSSTASAWSAHAGIAEAIWIGIAVVVSLAALRWRAVILLAMVLVSFSSAAYVYGSGGYTYPILDRHFMLPRVLLLVTITASIASLWRSHRRTARRNALLVGASLCIASSCVGVVHDFSLAPYGKTPRTAAFQSCLDQGRNVICRLAVSPPGFTIQVRKGP